jgi:hypothetical protein
VNLPSDVVSAMSAVGRNRLIFALALFLGSCAVLYSAKPTTGTVIDAGTREPIEGAVVVAEWILQGGMEHSRVGTLKILEVVTDKNGHFQIPGWGPEPAPINGVLDHYDPVIRIFKPGYAPGGGLNPAPLPIGERAAKQDHSWISRVETFQLEKYSGPPASYQNTWEGIYGLLYDVLNNGSGCDWKNIPRTVRILEDQAKQATTMGLRANNVSAKRLMERKQCAPFDDFVRAYSEPR